MKLLPPESIVRLSLPFFLRIILQRLQQSFHSFKILFIDSWLTSIINWSIRIVIQTNIAHCFPTTIQHRLVIRHRIRFLIQIAIWILNWLIALLNTSIFFCSKILVFNKKISKQQKWVKIQKWENEQIKLIKIKITITVLTVQVISVFSESIGL